MPRLGFGQLALGQKVREGYEHEDKERNANVDEGERGGGQVEEHRIKILGLDAAMVANHVLIIEVMLNDSGAEKRERDGAQRQYNSVQGDGAGIVGIVAHESGDEGDEGHPEKKNVVGPEQASIGASRGVDHVVMIDPHDGNDEKT
jgi:hypothetical protein